MKFQKPATPSGLKWDELKGSLLLIEALRLETGVSTDYGVKDAVAATVHVLDGAQAPTVFRETLVFPAVLQGQLRPAIGSGDPVLGRVAQGVAKKGQSPPWELSDPTSADEKVATEYLGNGAIGTAELGENGYDSENPPW